MEHIPKPCTHKLKLQYAGPLNNLLIIQVTGLLEHLVHKMLPAALTRITLIPDN